eukprot:6049813-Amphidinium_carterae.1
MTSWEKLRQTDAPHPLALVMPGRMLATLRKLGITQHVQELELLYRQPDGVLVARTSTVHSLGGHPLTVGGAVSSVTWLPQASREYILELDSRWCSDSAVDKAKLDWATQLNTLAEALAATTISRDSFFSLRHIPGSASGLWTARARLPQDVGEKLLGNSGTAGLFVKVPPRHSKEVNQHTIVWATKHQEAGPVVLADLLKSVQSIPGHRGLARSWTAVGARVPWTHIGQARALLCKEDPSFSFKNAMALHDSVSFVVTGLPAGVSPAEISRACFEQGWLAIPQRRLQQRDGKATWVLTSDQEPKTAFFRWGDQHVIVEKAADDDVRLQRKKTGRKPNTGTSEGQSAVVHSKGGQDPLQQHDPWKGKGIVNRDTHPETASSSGNNAQNAKAWEDWNTKAQAQRQQHAAAPSTDRVEFLAKRVSQLEENREASLRKWTIWTTRSRTSELR